MARTWPAASSGTPGTSNPEAPSRGRCLASAVSAIARQITEARTAPTATRRAIEPATGDRRTQGATTRVVGVHRLPSHHRCTSAAPGSAYQPGGAADSSPCVTGSVCTAP
jgi:hypothetical protein